MQSAQKKILNNGFTFVELLIAVIIIGILISLAIPNYARSVERAKCSQAIHVLKSMRSAALEYFNEIDHATMTQNTFTGVTVAILELQVGANFDSIGSNPDWAYTITTNTATRLVLQAERLGGPHQAAGNEILTLTDDTTNNTQELWGGSYPKDTPNVW